MFDLKDAEKTCQRLKAYPNLLGKVKEILDLVEKKQVETADDFEEALIPEVRGLGKELIETWAAQEEGSLKKQLEDEGSLHHSKKKSTGTQPLGK